MKLRLTLASILLTISPVFLLPTTAFALACYTNTGSLVVTNSTTCFPGTSATMPNNIYTQTNPPATSQTQTTAPSSATQSNSQLPLDQTPWNQLSPVEQQVRDAQYCQGLGIPDAQCTSGISQTGSNSQVPAANGSGLVQCGNPGQPACNLCSLLALIQILINYAIDLAFAFSGLFIAWGAFVIMTAGGSEQRVKKGKEVMTTAIIGLVIMLSAWLILGTVLQVLTGSATKLPWTSIKCTF
ncbi:hypothetical protein KGO95_04415 [Patescibacteria group bacterium]|nr:hypothetical protein [Patescibacteria group bacterium]